METLRSAKWLVFFGISLSFIPIVAPLAWADDDDNKGCKTPVIEQVEFDYEAEQILIMGDKLKYKNKTPKVSLADEEIGVISYDTHLIVAALPDGYVGDFLMGFLRKIIIKIAKVFII